MKNEILKKLKRYPKAYTTKKKNQNKKKIEILGREKKRSDMVDCQVSKFF